MVVTEKNLILSSQPIAMIDYIKRKLEKRKLKNTFKEYGFSIDNFEIEGIGRVQFANWEHPFEQPKSIKLSNINFYRKLTKEGGMIIDIGAHAGDTAVPMALAVGAKGLVLALEPNRYVFKILEKNATLNPGLTNIVALPYAATENEGTFTFNYSDASFCNGGFLSEIESQQHNHNYTLEVRGVNLEKYLLNHYANDLQRLHLLKIDAEGYDKQILKTLPNILSKYKPNLMVECYKRLNTQERAELFDEIANKGYSLYYLENFEEHGNKVKIDKSDMTKLKHFEILAIHKDREAEVTF